MKRLIYLVFIYILITTTSWARCCGMTASDCSSTIPPTYSEKILKNKIQNEFLGNREIINGGLILKAQLEPSNILVYPLSIKSLINLKTITVFSFNDMNMGNFIAKIVIPENLPFKYIDYYLRIKLNLTGICKGGTVLVIGEGLDGKLYFNKNIINGCY